jgi:hypothetical protein
MIGLIIVMVIIAVNLWAVIKDVIGIVGLIINRIFR